MLLRNLRPQDGLCNGTRLICTSFHDHLIGGTIISGSHTGSTVFIHRVPIIPTDLDLPFALKRPQFPVRPAFAMTINKSQGQTLNTSRFLPFLQLMDSSDQSSDFPESEGQHSQVIATATKPAI
ncbi:hypothetical protein B0O80DRAFT_257167 [Mortierella sp. GBAus27b]|nr:hypothetical protein B0O80DRAFT_257167 [Mortierella sp. GBAus27b]